VTSSDIRRGRLVVLAGPSGVGKSSVVQVLRNMYPELWFSVSATTRAQRPGERDGVDYRFVTADEFDHMIKNDELLEWAEIHRGIHRSGTPRAPIEERLAAGEPALVEVDLAGARNLRDTMPEAFLVFLSPPSWEALVERLVGRGTEAPEVVTRRLQTAKEELAAQEEFDAVVVNTDLRSAARDLLKLILDKPSSDQLEQHE
jgi:guanylate kinase